MSCCTRTYCAAVASSLASTSVLSFLLLQQVFEKSPALRRLMLGATNLTGTVPCALFDHNKLKTIMISINNLEGSLPDCVLAVGKPSVGCA